MQFLANPSIFASSTLNCDQASYRVIFL